jgi:hypothetical protein
MIVTSSLDNDGIEVCCTGRAITSPTTALGGMEMCRMQRPRVATVTAQGAHTRTIRARPTVPEASNRPPVVMMQVKRSRFSSKGKFTYTIYNVVDHESNPSHYQLSADIIVIHHRITSYKALQH